MKRVIEKAKCIVVGVVIAMAGTALTGCSLVDRAFTALGDRVGEYMETVTYDNTDTRDNFCYSWRTSDNTGYIESYSWDGSEEGKHINVPENFDDITITGVGGIHGRGVPAPFYVDIMNAMPDKELRRITFITDVNASYTEYIDFYLYVDRNLDDGISVMTNCYYEEETSTIYVSRVNVVDTTQFCVDTDYGYSLLPGVNEIESITYKAIVLGGGSGRVPGPTDYKYVGVAYISDASAETIAATYDLMDCDVDIDEEILQLDGSLQNKEWKTSNEFSNAVVKPGCSGRIYISGNVIYFEMSTY
ncbi:MAG: hypothetical protein MJ104_02440 [Lachnospiraceae bacterium]|nr:hypothetical protein [Lachnospiraceae bacterium]